MKLAKLEKRSLQNAQANHLFQSISGSKAMLLKFNVSNAWRNMWNMMMEEKAGAERQNSEKGFKKNEHACSVEGVFVVSDPTARLY